MLSTHNPFSRCGAPVADLAPLVFKLDTTSAAAIEPLCDPSTGAFLGPTANLHVRNSGSMPLDVRLPASGSVCAAEGEPRQLAGLEPGDARPVRMRMHPTAQLSSAQHDPLAVHTNSFLEPVVKLPVRLDWTRARVVHDASISSIQLASGGTHEASLQLRNTGNVAAEVAIALAGGGGLELSWAKGYTPPKAISAGATVTVRLVVRAPPGGPIGYQHASVGITTANDLDLTVSGAGGA